MSDYIEPTQASFKAAEAVATDVLAQAAPNAITKTGSVIHELVLRPLAYLISWATSNLEETRRKSSISYLQTSQATENEIADLVASNYFVTRKQGTRAKGIITLALTTVPQRLSAGSQFTVAGCPVHTPVQYFIITGDLSTQQQQSIQYVQARLIDGIYYANIAVETDATGKFEIPAGSDVTVGFACSALTSAELTSPITGGSDVETDAQLMQRAEYNTAEAGIGSYYGLVKKFNHAPITVTSLCPVAGEDVPLYRARYNTLNINPGGYIDCYIKTNNQPTFDTIKIPLTAGTSTIEDLVTAAVTGGTATIALVDTDQYALVIPGTKYAGLFNVEDVVVDGGTVSDIACDFGTSDPSIPANGARLSTYQTTTVLFTVTGLAALDSAEANVSIAYQPNLRELQDFIDSDEEAFIGQSILCKAAVPVRVAVNCTVSADHELSDEEMTTLKQAITDTINALPVGTKSVNFSDLRNACATAVPGTDLRVPCYMTGVRYTIDGRTETILSYDGVLDITKPVTSNAWDYQMCYFYTYNDNIQLGVL